MRDRVIKNFPQTKSSREATEKNDQEPLSVFIVSKENEKARRRTDESISITQMY